MIDEYTFNAIMTKLYEGYGRNIKSGQLTVMYHRLNHMTEDALRAVARKWIDHEPKPPVVSDINKMIGVTQTSEKKHVCMDCGSEVDNVTTVGRDENKKHVCSDCWYLIAKKQGAIPEWRLA